MNSQTATLDPMRLALVGVPNCGKTALFNRLTGSRQRVANYAGVTVERKEGQFVGPARQRLYKVLDTQLGKTGAYVAGDYSIADIACFPWTMTHKAQGFTLDDYPNVKRWYAEVRARPKVQAGLAIGKFVKEPFDEEARKNMFGERAKEMAGRK